MMECRRGSTLRTGLTLHGTHLVAALARLQMDDFAHSNRMGDTSLQTLYVFENLLLDFVL